MEVQEVQAVKVDGEWDGIGRWVLGGGGVEG